MKQFAWTQEQAIKAVQIWQTSKTKAEAMTRAVKELGCSKTVYEYRIYSLKKRGVKNLKKMPTMGARGFKLLDLEALNSLAQKHLKVKIKVNGK